MNKKYIKQKATSLDKKTFSGFHDYENKPIGGGNPYYCCSSCGRSDPEINGNLLNHSEHCSFRIDKLTELGYI